MRAAGAETQVPNYPLEALYDQSALDVAMAATTKARAERDKAIQLLDGMLFDLSDYDSDEDRLREFRRLRKESRVWIASAQATGLPALSVSSEGVPGSPPAASDAGIAELREVATLAYRALEDAHRALSPIDEDDTPHDQHELSLLAKRVQVVSVSLFTVLRNPMRSGMTSPAQDPVANTFGHSRPRG